MKRRFSALLLALLLICSLCVIPADAAPPANTATILFTHDLHSHFLPQAAEDGGESGGYARLKTAIDREREKNPDALLLVESWTEPTLQDTHCKTEVFAKLQALKVQHCDNVTIDKFND